MPPQTACLRLPGGAGPADASCAVRNLEPGTVCVFRAVALSEHGE